MLLKPVPKTATKLEVFKPKKRDIFDKVFDELPAEEKILHSPELKRLIGEVVKQAVSQLRPVVVTMPETREIVRETPAPVTAPTESKTYAEESSVSDLKEQISDLKKELAKVKRLAEDPIVIPGGPGGPGVIGIPPPEQATAGYVLTVNTQKKAEWKVATGGSGGGLEGFTVSGDTETLTLAIDDNLTIENLANVVATMINQQQA